MSKLTLDDIADLRQYEREREAFRDRIVALKQVRRVAVGPIVTLVFENRETMRYQVQEMARAERMLSDEQIQTELDTYNPLIPERGQLVATLFIELGTPDDLSAWLPKLVGIERAVVLRLGADTVHAAPDDDHAAQLTREDVTASVHYIRFRLDPTQVEAFAAGPVTLAIEHPEYAEATELTAETCASLLTDLRGND